MKVLLVDDDPDLLDVTAYALRRKGFEVVLASDGNQAVRRWESDEPDLIVLDLGLPRVSGLDVCRKIRQNSTIPIILLTGSADDEHIEKGFQTGADDYVTKPFSPRQLEMRIRAVMRRASGTAVLEVERVVQLGEFTLDVEAHQVTHDSEVVQLTPLEFRIFHLLALNEGRVVSFGRLVEGVWGYDAGEPGMLKTHISHLRKKLHLTLGQRGYIQVIHGVGYLLSSGASDGPLASAEDDPSDDE